MNINHIKTKVRYLNEYYPNFSGKEILKALRIITGFLDTSTSDELPEGCYFKNSGLRYVLIHPDVPEHDRNRVYVHELAHSILHPNINTLNLEAYDPVFVQKLELEADVLTSEILIPLSVLKEFKNESKFTIAENLKIPVRLVELRYNYLNKNELKELEEIEGIYAI